MSMSNTPILLRILSGVSAGAEMELTPGEWSLGSSGDSQLVLMDAEVMPEHLLLHVSGEGSVSAIPQGGVVLLAGEDIPAEGSAVPPFTVFTVGGVELCYGPTRAAWPEVSRGVSGSGQSDPGESSVSASNTQTGAPANNVATLEEVLRAANKVDGASGLAAPPNKGGRFFLPFGVSRRLLWVVLLVICGALVIDYSQFGLLFSSPEREQVNLTRGLNRQGFLTVSVVQHNGTLHVSGHVDTNVQLETLGTYLEKNAKDAQSSVYSLEDIVSGLRAAIKRADAALYAARSGESIILRGYAYNAEELERLLKEEAAALNTLPLKMNVKTFDEVKEPLQTLLQNQQLDKKTRIVGLQNHILVQVQPLNAREQRALQSFMRQGADIFGIDDVVRLAAWPSPEEEKAGTGEKKEEKPEKYVSYTVDNKPPQINSPAQDFSCKRLSVSGTDNDLGVIYGGVLYRQGGKLPDGQQIKHVTPAYVVLQRGKAFTRICTAAEMQ